MSTHACDGLEEWFKTSFRESCIVDSVSSHYGNFLSSSLKGIISKALACNPTPSIAHFVCEAIRILRGPAIAARQLSSTAPPRKSNSDIKLEVVQLTKLWMESWMHLKPHPGKGGEEVVGNISLVDWFSKAAEELALLCVSREMNSDASELPVDEEEASHLSWLAQAAMAMGNEAFQSGLWPQCYGASTCCFRLSRMQSHGQDRDITTLSQMQVLSACMAAHALLKLFACRVKGCWGSAANKSAMTSFVLLSPVTWKPIASTAGGFPPSALLHAARELLMISRKVLSQRDQSPPQSVEVQGCQPIIEQNGDRSLDDLRPLLFMLEFCVCTYASDESGQRQALQGLVELPGMGATSRVRGADFLQLAALCLEEEGGSWRNVPMACAALGFAIRAEHSLPSPDFPIIAQVDVCVIPFHLSIPLILFGSPPIPLNTLWAGPPHLSGH